MQSNLVSFDQQTYSECWLTNDRASEPWVFVGENFESAWCWESKARKSQIYPQPITIFDLQVILVLGCQNSFPTSYRDASEEDSIHYNSPWFLQTIHHPATLPDAFRHLPQEFFDKQGKVKRWRTPPRPREPMTDKGSIDRIENPYAGFNFSVYSASLWLQQASFSV